MVTYMAREGIPISRDRVRNHLRRMGFRAIAQKRRTTLPGGAAERFLCLVPIMDLHSMYVLISTLFDSLDTEFCLEAFQMDLNGGRKPEVFHSGQGCQFSSQ
jgi:putative transposase